MSSDSTRLTTSFAQRNVPYCLAIMHMNMHIIANIEFVALLRVCPPCFGRVVCKHYCVSSTHWNGVSVLFSIQARRHRTGSPARPWCSQWELIHTSVFQRVHGGTLWIRWQVSPPRLQGAVEYRWYKANLITRLSSWRPDTENPLIRSGSVSARKFNVSQWQMQRKLQIEVVQCFPFTTEILHHD